MHINKSFLYLSKASTKFRDMGKFERSRMSVGTYFLIDM